MSERVWDGRGDALDDARLTTVDGRMADDMRLKLPHFRVMAHVGRQNGRRGWLRVSQTELATRWACHRSTVNRAFADLVEWNYLASRTQHEAGESFCQYKVRLDGEDAAPGECTTGCAPGTKSRREDSGKPASAAGGGCTPDCAPLAAEGECAPDSTPPQMGSVVSSAHMCSVGEYTSVLLESTPPIDSARAHRLSPPDAEELPPTPRASLTVIEGEGRSNRRSGLASHGWHRGWDQAARQAVLDLLASDRRHVAEALLVPLVGTLPPSKGVHGASYVRDVADQVGEWPAEVLAVVAKALRVDRVADLPLASKIRSLARSVAAQMATGAGYQPQAASQGPDAWVREVIAGDASDPTNALQRALIERLGDAMASAWFGDVEVERDGEVLVLGFLKKFSANWVREKLAQDVLLAARGMWPDVAEIDVRVTGPRDGREGTHAA